MAKTSLKEKRNIGESILHYLQTWSEATLIKKL